jgi:hypothetical protein
VREWYRPHVTLKHLDSRFSSLDIMGTYKAEITALGAAFEETQELARGWEDKDRQIDNLIYKKNSEARHGGSLL